MEARDSRVRLLAASLAVTAALALFGIGWLTWIAADPEYWFPGAYSNKGPTGDEGPRGDKGPRGEQGPTGPPGPGVEDLEAQVGDLDLQLSDFDSRLSDIEDLEVRVDDACAQIYDHFSDSPGC